MKLKILALLLTPSIALASPSSTNSFVTNNLDGKIDAYLTLSSVHHYHLVNDTGVKQIYKIKTTLCATDKNDCTSETHTLGLENGQEYAQTYNMIKNVSYRRTGSHPINASTEILGYPTLTTNDQKYIWIHY